MVELLGLPGCGKSTYGNFVEGSNNLINPFNLYIYNDSRFIQNINKIYPLFFYVCQNFHLSCRLCKLLLKIQFRDYSSLLKMGVYLFSVLGCISLGKKKYDDKRIIIDEGVHQVLWGILYLSNNSELEVKKMWGLLKDLYGDITYFDIDDKTIIIRLLRRTNCGGAELQHDLLSDRNSINKAKSCMRYVFDLANSQGLVKTIVRD